MPDHTDELSLCSDEKTQPADIGVHDTTSENQLYRLFNRMMDSTERAQERQSLERRDVSAAQIAALNASTTAQVEALKGVQAEVKTSTWISFAAVCLLAVALTGGNFALKFMGAEVQAGQGGGAQAKEAASKAGKAAAEGVAGESDSADQGGEAGS